MANSKLFRWIKTIILLFVLFFTFSEVKCEAVSEEVVIKLQEAFCDVWCLNKVNCKCSTSETELKFQNYTNQMQIEWLCRDETVISFQWSSNKSLTYVFEYSEKGEGIFCETTKDNFAILEDLESDEEYQIKVWGVSADGNVYGPFFSEPVRTISENHTPLEVPTFELVNWKFASGTLFDAVLEWTPAEDRLCFYEIVVHSEEQYKEYRYVTKDMESLFKTTILGFNSGHNYTISISPKLSNSFSWGPSKWLSVYTPNCLELYKSVDKCVPNPPEDVNVNEVISTFFKHGFRNVTFDVHVTWSIPQHMPDNYSLEIIVFKNDHPRIVQNITGEATSVVFYNVTVTPHYYLKMTSWSKAGSSKSLMIDRMINIRPDMIAVAHPKDINYIVLVFIATCVINILILLGICLMKVKKIEFKDIEMKVLVENDIQRGEFKKLDGESQNCW